MGDESREGVSVLNGEELGRDEISWSVEGVIEGMNARWKDCNWKGEWLVQEFGEKFGGEFSDRNDRMIKVGEVYAVRIKKEEELVTRSVSCRGKEWIQEAINKRIGNLEEFQQGRTQH